MATATKKATSAAARPAAKSQGSRGNSARPDANADVCPDANADAQPDARPDAYAEGYVEAYIEKAAPFAQPILRHLRGLIHKAVPDVEEAIKWSRPFFLYRGVILGNISAFKEHCSLGLWGQEMAAELRAAGMPSAEAMGNFGRITKLEDLPPDSEMLGYFRKAAALIADGVRTQSLPAKKPAQKRPELPVPAELVAALEARKGAAGHFAAMSPGCRREYCEWVGEAKREETRQKRAATAAEWIADGKKRNWQYETC